MKKVLAVLSILLFSITGFGQGNNLCANAQPFCTGQIMNFPAGVNAGVAQPGPNYGCLGSQPNPAWFYMQIQNGGPLVITMSANQDIDFICWGPFPSLNGACNNLTAGNTVDCSYSGSNTETCTIANAIPGQFYLLLITNFANVNQQITFQQINAGQPGAATTNCGILCSFTVSGTNSLCAGNSVNLAAVGGTNIININWIAPGYNSNNNPNPVIPNVNATTVYTAIATTTGTNPGTNTCAISKTVTVVQNPTANVNNNGPICAGSNANFNCNGGGTYAWTGPAGFTSNLSNPVIPGAQSQHNGVYSVTVTLNTCTASASTSLQVKPNPVVTAANSGSYCEGQSFALQAAGATNYTWTGPNNFSSNQQNPPITNNNLNHSGTYTVLGATNGCTATATTSVLVNPLPSVQASSSGQVCQSTPLTLSASGAVNYIWSGPGGFSSNQGTINIQSAPLTMNGTYSVTGIDANGCVNTATVFQLVNQIPYPVAYGAKACLNEGMQLTASGASSYFWLGPNNYTSAVQNPVITNVNYGHGGTYTVIATSAAGCTNAAVASATVFANPVITFSGNTEVCSGEVFKFTAQGGTTYNWVIPWGTISNNPTFSISSVSPDLQMTYSVVGFDANGCASTVAIKPVVLPLPAANVFPDAAGACVPFKAGFNLYKISQNITGVNWILSNGTHVQDSLKVYQDIVEAGTHLIKVELKDSHGCKNIVSNTVAAWPAPDADFTFSNESPTEMESEVTFYDNSRGAPVVDWTWDFWSNGQYTSTMKTPTFNYPVAGHYFITMRVKSDKGCTDSIIKKLVVEEDLTFYIPNSFTPNNDGLNDVFGPKGVGVKKYKMEIYDRWGQLLFSTTDFNEGWDGRKGGVLLPSEVYVYLIDVVQREGGQSKHYAGHFTLLK